ncbi:phage tail sheath family protein [Pedobacter xixiisoli]|nr:phage tail sheath C-terminal domain-containing protein [Pedobacter xixiisoli]
MKTPGVYLVEKNAFPNSVVEVATAVPAFIGYTEKAINGSHSLSAVPWRVSSLAEYVSYFGEGPKSLFHIDTTAVNDKPVADLATAFQQIKISLTDKFSFYRNLKLFFANGGGPCYIVSVGSYHDELNKDTLISGIATLLKEQEPTMVIVPEAVNLTQHDYYEVQNAIANHCGQMHSRVAIVDVYEGYKDRKDANGDVVSKFREQMTTPHLSYVAAYYPWLHTSIVAANEVSFANITPADIANFKAILKAYSPPALVKTIDSIDPKLAETELQKIHQLLYQEIPLYAMVMQEMLQQLNLLPTAAAMAGIYCLTDNTKEVWKAPANVGMANIISTAVNISHQQQEDLNVPLEGKAVNAIRYFTGEGIKVWGARTLDANSLDWRYINVRRTMIMLTESIKSATKAFVFEPNVANTWVTVRSMLINFLNGIWKRGGLAGAVPEDAFSVHIGLGETMSPDDILEGIMRITVLVAISRPAEFIEITFQQQMQKS